MNTLKAACVAWGAEEIPEWVPPQIEAAGVEFAALQCQTPSEALLFARDADIIWVMGGSNLITREIIPQLDSCGAIIRSGSGTDNIPVDLATEYGIIVANTPDATTVPVAEHTIGLLLSVVRRIPIHDRLARQGGWNNSTSKPRFLLQGSTVGLIGFGRIARCVANRLVPFGVKLILVYDPFVDAEAIVEDKVKKVELPQLLSESDFISIHTPLIGETHHMISEAEISQMKSTCVVINTSRGSVVDNKALTNALREGRIWGAGLDVLESEPPDKDDLLLQLDNVVLTSHIGAQYEGHLDGFWQLSVETIIDLSRGKWPVSYVNPKVRPRWELAER